MTQFARFLAPAPNYQIRSQAAKDALAVLADRPNNRCHLTISRTGDPVWEFVEETAQGCFFDQKVGEVNHAGFACVLALPPSDCMGGRIVWQKPI